MSRDAAGRSLAGWRSTHAQAIYAGVTSEERAAATRMLAVVKVSEG